WSKSSSREIPACYVARHNCFGLPVGSGDSALPSSQGRYGLPNVADSREKSVKAAHIWPHGTAPHVEGGGGSFWIRGERLGASRTHVDNKQTPAGWRI